MKHFGQDVEKAQYNIIFVEITTLSCYNDSTKIKEDNYYEFLW